MVKKKGRGNSKLLMLRIGHMQLINQVGGCLGTKYYLSLAMKSHLWKQGAATPADES